MNNIDDQITHLLDGHSLRPTGCRSAVLQEFFSHEFAISHAYLEKSLNKMFDRVTIYRTLNTFLDNGIIHKVIDDEGIMKYAICSEHCEDHKHDDQHVHFKCNDCEQTFCMEEISIPSIPLPRGYQFSQANLLIHGICKDCTSKTA